ncbi:phage putative head morphogenesis protein%2C SPP1 gp7 family [Streptococcus pneumoniae]|nr:phage putative head morphogenesis protein%2C SPP1 gp7 family [Streptococcus pneumoniae]
MDKAEKQADQFDKVYQEAKTYLDKEVNKIFDKFQRDYGLSQVEARQVLKNMKDKKNLNELRKVLEARPNDPNIQRLLADLDSPAYSFRMKRLSWIQLVLIRRILSWSTMIVLSGSLCLRSITMK